MVRKRRIKDDSYIFGLNSNVIAESVHYGEVRIKGLNWCAINMCMVFEGLILEEITEEAVDTVDQKH